MPLDETLGALDDLVRAGKVRYIGSSTAPAWHVVEAVLTAELKGVVRDRLGAVAVQPARPPIENELVPCLRAPRRGHPGLVAAGHGHAGRRYADGRREADSRAALRGGIYAERVTPTGSRPATASPSSPAASGTSRRLLAAAWIAGPAAASPRPSSARSTLDQLQTLLPAGELDLDDDVRAACDALVPPGSAVTSFFNSAGW